MGHLFMIFFGATVLLSSIDKWDWSCWFLLGLILLWLWDYNDTNNKAKNNVRSYYNRRIARKLRERRRHG